MNILITGNCQSRPIFHFIQRFVTNDQSINVEKWPELHLIQSSEVESLLSRLDTYDLVLCMPVADNYRGMPLGTSQIKSRMRESARLIVYPNLCLYSYFPTFGYIKGQDGMHITAGHSRLSGFSVFGDYHDHAAFHSWHLGMSPAEYLDATTHASTEIRSRILEIHENSLAELVSRHVDTEFSAIRTISELCLSQRTFHSFNHPVNFLLEGVARESLALSGIPHSPPSDSPPVDEYLSLPLLPISKLVANSLNLNFSTEQDQLNANYENYFDYLNRNQKFFREVDIDALPWCDFAS
jgi:hypothetical protein